MGMGMAVSESRSSVRPQGGARPSVLRAGAAQHPRAGEGQGHQAHRWEGPGLGSPQPAIKTALSPSALLQLGVGLSSVGGCPEHRVVLSRSLASTLSMSVAFPL